METRFNPNVATFDEGVARVQEALKEIKLNTKKIVTSRDKDAVKISNLLSVNNTPDGFKKWQLPFIFDKSQLFISIGQPDVEVPNHSHDEGDGIRFIMSGSIYFDGKELSGGDWMFIPKGEKYSMSVGPMGVVMCYCYSCCCAPRALNRDDLRVLPVQYAR